MKKALLVVALVVVLAVAGGVFYLLSNLDALVKQAIETYGSQATQTAVRVDTVRIRLKEGSGSILGLTVANPSGFPSPLAFSLGEIGTRIDLSSLSGEVVVIDEIVIRAPQVFCDIDAAGRNNLAELNKALGSGGRQEKAAKPAEPGKEPKLIIRRLLFENGLVQARVAPLNGKEYQVKLPAVEMRNLGGKNGATPAQIADQVLKKLTDQALVAVRDSAVGQQLDGLKSQAKERLDAETKKATDQLKGLLGR